MNQEDIIRMAREAGMVRDYDCFFSPGDQDMDVHITDLERFAALVAAAEREACAEVADKYASIGGGFIADEIRERGKKKDAEMEKLWGWSIK